MYQVNKKKPYNILVRGKSELAPNPFQVIEASKKSPKKRFYFSKSEEGKALAMRTRFLKQGKTALLGSDEKNYIVEVY